MRGFISNNYPPLRYLSTKKKQKKYEEKKCYANANANTNALVHANCHYRKMGMISSNVHARGPPMTILGLLLLIDTGPCTFEALPPAAKCSPSLLVITRVKPSKYFDTSMPVVPLSSIALVRFQG